MVYYLRARYYDPSTGQFISRDPAVATTREPYAYVGDNPLNATDPTGLFGLDDLKHAAGSAFGAAAKAVGIAHEAAVIVVQATAAAVYVPYYGAYETMSAVNGFGDRFGPGGTVASRILTAPLILPEAAGLGADIGMDWFKNKAMQNGEPTCDEGVTAPILGHYAKSHGVDVGNMYFPGVHSNGTVDWQW